jgi:hypothetical protein
LVSRLNSSTLRDQKPPPASFGVTRMVGQIPLQLELDGGSGR